MINISKQQIKIFTANDIETIEIDFENFIKTVDIEIEHISSTAVFNNEYEEMEHTMIMIYHYTDNKTDKL